MLGPAPPCAPLCQLACGSGVNGPLWPFPETTTFVAPTAVRFPQPSHSTFDAQTFRILLLHLWLPLPLSSRVCRCGRLVAIAEARFLCGVSSGTCVQESWRKGDNQHSDQDMDIAIANNIDERCVEILVDGLQFFGARVAVDVTLVPRCADVDGAVLFA